MVALYYLKYQHDLSGEAAAAGWWKIATGGGDGRDPAGADCLRQRGYHVADKRELRCPTDARLYSVRERLIKGGRKSALSIKQSYERMGRRLVMIVGRYAHSRQMKRSKRCVRKLRANLARVIREIERQCAPESMRALFDTSKRIHVWTRGDKEKAYSVYETEARLHPQRQGGAQIGLSGT